MTALREPTHFLWKGMCVLICVPSLPAGQILFFSLSLSDLCEAATNLPCKPIGHRMQGSSSWAATRLLMLTAYRIEHFCLLLNTALPRIVMREDRRVTKNSRRLECQQKTSWRVMSSSDPWRIIKVTKKKKRWEAWREGFLFAVGRDSRQTTTRSTASVWDLGRIPWLHWNIFVEECWEQGFMFE